MAAALAVLGLAACLGLLWATARPPFPLSALSPAPSTVVAARNGLPLRLFLAPDQSWRFPVRLGTVSPLLPRLVVAAEDKRFFRHPGVDPLALGRAAVANLLSGRVVSGGSTLTMQLARLARPRPRTFAAKVEEALAALALERHLSKEAILERYLSMAPYGGNIVGVGAASTFYFGKTPDRLSLAEAALLTVLPRSPLRLDPVRHPTAAKAARDRLLAALARRGVVTAEAAAEASRAPLPTALADPPFVAPQFCQLARELAGPAPRIDTTLDPSAQKAVTDILRGRKAWLAGQGIGAVAAVVLDASSREVLAMVGSTDYFGDTRFGQINGATIRRSPGSALKPFLYAMALDKGLVFPQSLLLDIPTGFAGYSPKNYDGHFRGRVTMEQALVTSLNVPAVRLLNDVGPASFLDLLRRGGITTLDRPAGHYGLSLVLGGGEVTLLSLAGLYADLAGGGEHRPPRLLAGRDGPGTRLFSAEACALVTETLAKVERPDLPSSWERALAVPAVAWKTGTSYGHRDAWALGYSADRVIGVWVGNMDGAPVKGISGAVHVGPILFELFRAVEAHGSRLATAQGLNLREIEVCADSRQLPGPDCPRHVTAKIIPGVTRLGPCPVHRRLLVDAATGRTLSGDCLETREAKPVVVARYPAELVSWWRASGIPFEEPPEPEPGCGAPAGEGPRIVSPSSATPYVFRRDAPAEFQRIALLADVPAGSRRLSWYVDGELAAQGLPGERLFWQPSPGAHRLVVADDQGRADAVTVRVE
ncbi:penicillin-binding protein 1C [Solidesulfovibrio carbinoliphilus subsp. oakridgensis]|uniref:peptidoglycan glycosyltransferase n=1 Tax=Solidesulfovibrio carbinoliphilus subsp. oakridgensis TaxID=694327 RepID=G7Q4M4_9BACT|nr:penicillin-binding protein 1C [Solidesulfovibrio carbinoliphilus]EHJ47247.1 penicillin-binding protein 1C [Solidesulfovibrio carbinoliphilus subsp. oakridgensis]